MASDEGKKEDQFSFTDQGESLGYISLEQEEGEDYYIVTLSLRPQGDFEGTAGQEQFFIEKEGNVAHRQVLSLPRPRRRGFPVIKVGIGIVVVAVVAVVALTFAVDNPDDKPGPEIAAGSTPTLGTPPAGPTPVSRPKGTPVITVPPVGHKLSVAGFPAQPGETTIRIPNGTVFLSESPDSDGIYRDNLEVTLKVTPDQPGSEVIWGGVDFQKDNVSGVIMGDNRSVSVEIVPPPTPRIPDSADDHGNTFETATSMFLGSATGTIDSPDDVDLFHFIAESAQRYIAEVVSDTGWDTNLRLYDDYGSTMEEDYRAGSLEGASSIVWTATGTGNHFIEVSSQDRPAAIGSYTLYLELLFDDYGNSPESAADIFLGSIDGVIEVGLDLDYFRFFADAGASYVAEVYLGTHEDTILALFDQKGNLIQENDDGEGLDGGSRIGWTTPPIVGEYFLVVGSADQDLGPGSYTLSVTIISDDHGNSFDSATFMSPGSIFGTINPPSDLDFFQFYAEADKSYVFEVVPEDHPDTVLALYQPGRIKLDENDDVEDLNGGSRIFWTAEADGDYFLEVRSYDPDFQTGSYVIYLDLGAGPQSFLTGFYSGSITSAEDGSTAQLELTLDEDSGSIDDYLTLYDPHVGSGEIDSGFFSDGFLQFTVPSIYQGTSFSCDYWAEDLSDNGSIIGLYECFNTDGTDVDNGDWSAYR